MGTQSVLPFPSFYHTVGDCSGKLDFLARGLEIGSGSRNNDCYTGYLLLQSGNIITDINDANSQSTQPHLTYRPYLIFTLLVFSATINIRKILTSIFP